MPEADLIRVLVVDDDAVDRLTVRRALSGSFPCEVEEAEDVASGLRALEERQFDCILLDFNIPGSDAFEFLAALKQAAPELPVIMLTGQRDTAVAVELMKSGAADYLAKDALTGDRLMQAIGSAVRLQRAEHRARLADLRFRMVQETSPDGFVILSAVRGDAGVIDDFLIEYVNPAAAALWDNSPQDVIGKRMLGIAPESSLDDLFDLYTQVVETGHSRRLETQLHYRSFDLWLRITAVKLEDGVAVGVGDITNRKLAEAEMQRILEGRSRFYAAMSHELRTPINAILGYNDLMLAEVFGELPIPIRTSVEKSQRATRQLLELVNDVLDLSKLEAGRLEIIPEDVDVPQIMEELLATVQPLAAERKIQLDLAGDLCQLPIRTDPRRLRQILLNLISNAIKYGAGNPVVVTCALDEQGWLELKVVDQGHGIPPEELSRIFEEFVQLPNANEGGTGLGLPISRRLATLLGGNLEVESEPGKGSTFRLRLPTKGPGVMTEKLIFN